MREWVDAKLEHIREVKPHELQKISDADLDAFLSSVDRNLLETYAVTWLDDGRPIAMLGAFPFWPGVATIWALLSEDAIKRGPALTRAALRFIDALVDNDKLRRVQAMIRVDHPEACSWMRNMDFEREGLMQRAAPDGADMWLYARYF